MSTSHVRPHAQADASGIAATFPRDWWSFAGALGGATAGAVLDAVEALLPEQWQPRTAAFQYLSAVRDEPLAIAVTVVRRGRSSIVLSVEATVEGEPALLATVLGAPVDEVQGRFTALPIPRVAPPEECEEVELPRDLVPVSQHVELRFATDARPTSGGDVADLVAWVRLKSGAPYGPGDLAVLSDVMPPALFGIAQAPVIMPTADLSMVLGQHEPVTGYVLVRMTARHLDRAWAVDDCDIWSLDGALLVQSRQSRRLLSPLRP